MGLFPPHREVVRKVTHGYKGKGSLLYLLFDDLGNLLAIYNRSWGDERGEVQKLLDPLKGALKKSQKEKMVIFEVDKRNDSAWLKNVCS